MSTHNPEDIEFVEMLKESPSGGQAPDGLKARLRMMAAEAKRPRRTWVPRMAFVAAGTVAVVAGATMLWPTQASAKSLQKVVDATNQAASFSITVDESRGGDVNHVQIVGDETRFEVRTDKGELFQMEGAKMSVYDPKENTLTVITLSPVADSDTLGQVMREGIREGIRQFDVKKLVEEFKAEYGEQNARISDIHVENGREVYTIELQAPKEASRATVTVDANTDLPQRIQIHEQGSDADMRLEFGGAVQIEPIEKLVPKSAKRLELDFAKLIEQGVKLGEGMVERGYTIQKFDGKLDEKDLQGLKTLVESLARQSHKR